MYYKCLNSIESQTTWYVLMYPAWMTVQQQTMCVTNGGSQTICGIDITIGYGYILRGIICMIISGQSEQQPPLCILPRVHFLTFISAFISSRLYFTWSLYCRWYFTPAFSLCDIQFMFVTPIFHRKCDIHRHRSCMNMKWCLVFHVYVGVDVLPIIIFQPCLFPRIVLTYLASTGTWNSRHT